MDYKKEYENQRQVNTKLVEEIDNLKTKIKDLKLENDFLKLYKTVDDDTSTKLLESLTKTKEEYRELCREARRTIHEAEEEKELYRKSRMEVKEYLEKASEILQAVKGE